ncbi:oncomodulin-like isoform X2 [Gigantopelta aegis]|uniref:oncomodulin-like isoform X2 n=1 Tax=Gigantopelta aegis TaxID=1735272 RepID=UPI001B88A8BA|nr:oncomodulin-like isoform X2 [Gigantopelta aegis]
MEKQMKLLLVLLLITCVAFQQLDAWPRVRVRVTFKKKSVAGGDVARDLDTDEDGYLDETELEKYLGQRDVLDFVEALDKNGDGQLSVDEFNDKQ